MKKQLKRVILGCSLLAIVYAVGAFVSKDSVHAQVVNSVGGGAPSGVAGGDLSGTYPNPGVAKVLGLAQFAPLYLATAMAQQTTATCTDITGMTWNLAASKNYLLSCKVPVTGVASSQLQFCLNGPGSPTSYTLEGLGGTSTTPAVTETFAQTAWGNKTTLLTYGAATRVWRVDAQIQNGSTASGTALTLQTAANGTNGITVGADTSCQLTQVN